MSCVPKVSHILPAEAKNRFKNKGAGLTDNLRKSDLFMKFQQADEFFCNLLNGKGVELEVYTQDFLKFCDKIITAENYSFILMTFIEKILKGPAVI